MNDKKILGDYSLIKQIGQGALGAVFLAEHRFMKKQYAVKILPEDLCSSENRNFIQRFEEEVAILASLEHSHIARIHNISFASGQYFLVTDCIVDEFGETTNLAQYLLSRGNELTESEIYQMLYQLATALDYAHQARKQEPIFHSGIKLNNIVVSRDENGIKLHFTDFGLSRIIGPGAFLSRTYKNVAETLGQVNEDKKFIPLHSSFLQSYHFMAPEQRRLDSHFPVGQKVDIYAFGILAYYLLMCEYPEGYFEMPSERWSKATYDWDKLITNCLQRDPHKRPEKLAMIMESIKVIKEAESTSETNDGQLRPVIHVPEIERPAVDHDPGRVFQVDTTVKQYRPETRLIKNVEPLITEMAVIKGGTFARGCNEGCRDEIPRHNVTLSSFAIDIHPITNEQFVRFLEVMGGEKDSNHRDIIRLRDSRIKRSAGKWSIESGYTKHPVVGVTWYGAVAYAKWIGKRLPTEAEWEIAAYGGFENPNYPTGEDIEKSQANFFSSDTTAVMSYAPNSAGLYDMCGNVYEWCHDWYGYNYYETSQQEPENPKGPLQGVYRVLRGGCWKSLKEDLRCSKRHRNNPGTVNSTYGFRCAADVQ